MALGISANRQELLLIADSVAREKSIDREIVISAIEEAMEKGARAKYGAEHDIRAVIDPRSGELTLTRYLTVIEDQPDALVEPDGEIIGEPELDADGNPIEKPRGFIGISAAKRLYKDAEIGKVYTEQLPAFEMGRVQTQMARQVVLQKVREAERERQFEEFKDRVGDIINGTVKRVEYGNIIVDLGRGEGIVRRDQSIPREAFNIGDRIRTYIYDVRRENKGPQIMLSRAHGGFMAKLFAQEVPEVYDGVIEIRAVARDPGSRAKMAVISNDSSIDPVGACVGMRGSRVQAVVAELQGEKIDIIQWNQDDATFLVNALAPAEVSKVVIDEEEDRVEVVVPDEQLSLAIGRRGQNVRLASQLCGWQIDIITEAQDSERRQREFAERTVLFQEALDVDEMVAQLLVTEGFAAVEDIAYVDELELADIEGFDEETAAELQARAREFLDKAAAELDAKRKELGVEDGVLDVKGVTLPMAVALGTAGVKTVEDLADLSTDELRGGFELRGEQRVKVPGALESFNIAPEVAEKMILRARVAAGWIDASDVQEDEEPVAYDDTAETHGEHDGELPVVEGDEAVAEDVAPEQA